MRREYLPLESLPAWIRLNGITANGVEFQSFGSAKDDPDKGNAIVATQDRSSKESDALPEILLQVPSDLILSWDMVHEFSKSDQHLRDVLEAVGEFGRTARGAIMIFLLLQMTHSSPDNSKNIGVSSPWTEYMGFLPPSFPLPTSYTEEERQLLRGTSLATAVEAKITSLEREFELLREATADIAWCQQCWWSEDAGSLTFHDWVYVDAAYRSRMVDLPRNGHAMVPCIDMANHVFGKSAKALYDEDLDGNVILQLRWGQDLQSGDEVTISYGDEKSAPEMIFSYGFLESDRDETKQVTLDIELPDDDPLGLAKKMICREIPGIRFFTTQDVDTSIEWESPLIWWASVNEEDGLHIGVTATTDGKRELETTWKGEKIGSPHELREFLANDPSWEIFQLRAVVLVLQRLETQLSLLQETEDALSNLRENQFLLQSMFRPEVFALVSRLRKLETVLLEKIVEQLLKQKNELMQSDTVISYLAQQPQPEEDDDFS